MPPDPYRPRHQMARAMDGAIFWLASEVHKIADSPSPAI
jgi:hypothetical protein